MQIPFLSRSKKPKNDQIVELKLDQIKVNPFQPRQTFKQSEIKELAQSISNFGLIQAITVRELADGYELIAGERRLRAAKYLEKKTIPAVIKDLSDQEMAEIALIENLQRKDLSFLEEAQAYQRLLVEFDLTQKELAARVAKSQSTISNKLRLLKLEAEVREKILAADLSERHSRALLQLNDAQKQLAAIKKIKEKSLNVRESEKLIKRIKKPVKKQKKIKHLADDLRLYANSLEKRIEEIEASGIKIELEKNKEKNSIEYYIKLFK
ncbi:MAG: ParB/RepB/Spo0J family partition protein [Bacillota bacterium]